MVRSRAAAESEAVTILSAHSAAGREWDVVVVAGVQEGLWPSLRARGTLLGIEALIDAVSGADGGDDSTTRLSRTAPLLADERRLFLVACSRARMHLLVTAVDSVGGDTELVRSRFVDELLGHDDENGSEQPVVPDECAPAFSPCPRSSRNCVPSYAIRCSWSTSPTGCTVPPSNSRGSLAQECRRPPRQMVRHSRSEYRAAAVGTGR